MAVKRRRRRRSKGRAVMLRVWAPTHWLGWLSVLLWAAVRPRASLVLENVALRQQLGVLRRAVERPRVTASDRLFWVLLHRLHTGCDGMLTIVSPSTVVKWHRAGFRALWRWKSRRKHGRPPIGWTLVHLIRRLSRENTTWGAKRIHDELVLLGHSVGVETVRRYMLHSGNPRCAQSWKAFIKNHMGTTAACDFFGVPTATLRRLFVLVILSHDRREIRHVAVTHRPSVAWTAAELANAFPEDLPRPKYLVHDREKTFGCPGFLEQLTALEIDDKRTAPRQPWMNCYAERVIGTLRRECTDHMIALNAAHLERVLLNYVAYYNASRTHISLEGNAPWPRAREPTPAEELAATPVLGGLHHTYRRAA